MYFEDGHIYHVYNRSNELLFYSKRNYTFFLDHVRRLIVPHCEVLSWCLMPNHFHFLIQANKNSIERVGEKHRPNLQMLPKNIGTVLSSYTQSINKAQKRRGSLFAHHTKAKSITLAGNHYLKNIIYYIHQNPLEAGIVENLEEWEFSSFREFSGLISQPISNVDLVLEILNQSRSSILNEIKHNGQ